MTALLMNPRGRLVNGRLFNGRLINGRLVKGTIRQGDFSSRGLLVKHPFVKSMIKLIKNVYFKYWSLARETLLRLCQPRFQYQFGISTCMCQLVTESNKPLTLSKVGTMESNRCSCAVIQRCGCSSKGWRIIVGIRRGLSCMKQLKYKESVGLPRNNIETWSKRPNLLL